MSEKLGYAILSALIYGSWAFFANGGDDPTSAVSAGVVQAVCSFGITLSLAIFSVRVFLFLRPPSVSISLLVVVSGFSLILYVMHWIAGTGRIFVTILPSIIMGGLFCFYILRKEALIYAGNK